MTTEQRVTIEGKADFSSVYVQPDPGPYFEILEPLGYQIPEHAVPVVKDVLAASGGQVVLDLCCSYGINAALLRYDVTLAEFSALATDPEQRAGSVAEIRDRHSRFFAGHRRPGQLTFRGLDASGPAIDYAVAVGLLEDGWAADLETSDPPTDVARGIADVDLVLCTGGVGYIGASTFRRVLQANAHPENVRVVSMVLRAVDYQPIADVLGQFGLVTERRPGRPVRQRRFADEAEQAAAIAGVCAAGLAPAGLEETGWFYADCYVSRPA